MRLMVVKYIRLRRRLRRRHRLRRLPRQRRLPPLLRRRRLRRLRRLLLRRRLLTRLLLLLRIRLLRFLAAKDINLVIPSFNCTRHAFFIKARNKRSRINAQVCYDRFRSHNSD